MDTVTMPNGTFILMLHSHLPYYRKAGVWPHGEESLFECLAECYLPLLVLLENLAEEGIKPGLTLGLTPVLMEQLADPYLMHNAVRHLETQQERARQDAERYKDHPELGALAKTQAHWFEERLHWLEHRFKRNLLPAFSRLQQQGSIELVASAASHGFLPLLGSEESIALQVGLGKQVYEQAFEATPKGFWLPECAYKPGLENFLEAEGFTYTFTEYHAVDGASTNTSPSKPLGIYASKLSANTTTPAQTMPELGTHQAYRLKNSQIAVLGRDNETSFQVWSSMMGYPGDGLYREFYKTDDISGLRYWRLTDKGVPLSEKHLYNPEQAQQKAKEHAHHFVNLVARRLREQADANNGHAGLLTTAFDTELFGHWWFEGITWLEHVLRGMAEHPHIAMQTASNALAKQPAAHSIELPECTWGDGGHFWVWNNNQVDWMWPAIYEAEQRMNELVHTHANNTDPLTTRGLNQALRELLLLQASDWPFLVTTYQAKDYALQRFESHRANFWQLCSQLERNQLNPDTLATLEEKNCLFPSLHFSQWGASKAVTA
jgi:1,4-alpha-glucan branching enzyme